MCLPRYHLICNSFKTLGLDNTYYVIEDFPADADTGAGNIAHLFSSSFLLHCTYTVDG